jgi:hypothetical protein
MVLGTGGQLFAVKAGEYGGLFPGGRATDATNTVLAVDVVRADAAVERLLVPGTEGSEVERLPSLVFEEASGTVFLVWESRINVIHPVLMLSGLDPDGKWFEPVEVVGNAFANKTSPQLAITRDVSSWTTNEGDTITRYRTVLHLLWGEEDGTGLYETFYTPIVFDNGVLNGRNPIYELGSFDPAKGEATSFALSPELVRVAKIQAGRDERTVVVAFTSQLTRRLVTLEIDWLPVELASLADGLRSQIIDTGVKVSYPANRAALATKARAGILANGAAFHPEILRALADRIYAAVLSDSGSNLVALADGLRSQIIDTGAKLSGRGLRRLSSTAPPAGGIAEIPAGESETHTSHLIEFRLASSRPAPAVGAGPVTLFVSENGEDTMIAWNEIGRLLYRESRGDGWSEVLELRLNETFDLARALDVLQRRVRTH